MDWPFARLIRHLRIGYKIPELRKEVATVEFINLLWLLALPVSIAMRLPWSILNALEALAWRLTPLLDVQTPCGLLRQWRSKVIDKGHETMPVSEVRKRMGWF